MDDSFRAFSMALLLCLSTIKTYTQSQQQDFAKKIDSYLNTGISNGFSGALLVEHQGKILLNKGYGMANKKAAVPNTPNTVFDIGSNTKQFTAAAILKLIEMHKLKVTDSLHTFFKDLPLDKKNITIHQLLSHTGGFQESLASDFEQIPTTHFFKNVFESGLVAQPGTKFNYSNIGYSILARIIEITSTMPFEEFLQHYLFQPAGMVQTGYLLPNWKGENLANGYNRNVLDQGTSVERYHEDGEVSWNLKGNGGINSNLNDMLLWKNAIQNHKILSQKSIEKWVIPYTREINNYYGYGWGVYDNDDKVLYHNGGNGAFTHTIIWNWTRDYFIVYASNASSPKVEDLAYEIENVLLNSSYIPKEIEKNPYFLVMDFIKQHQPSDAEKLLQTIKTKYHEDFDHSGVLNRLGYMTMRSKEYSDWAVALFELNTLLFENDANVWDSLGDGYVTHGKIKEAVTSFKKAVALGNEASLEKLEKLQGKDE